MKRKILLVDDDQDILDMMSKVFINYGYDTILTSSGHDAISILKKEKVHFVVSDFKMPNGSGPNILSFVNSMNTKPIFYFFSAEHEGVLNNYLKDGVKKVFTKPFSIEKLLDELGRESQHNL